MNFDINDINARAKSVDLNNVLESIWHPIHTDALDYPEFPPLHRSFQRRLDWWDRSKDDTPPITGPDLGLYYALGYAVRPYLIMALGVGFGYELMCVAKGSRDAGVPNATCNGYDDEVTRPGSLEWARQAFIADRVPYNLSHSNARQYDVPGIPLRHIDLFHISSLANARDLQKDLELAVPTLSPRGVIIVDNIVPADCADFATKHGFRSIQIGALAVLDRS